MASSTAAAFNRLPTLANFATLAQLSPREARDTIALVTKGLEKAALPADLKAQLDSMLRAEDALLPSLVQNSMLLRSIFPDGPQTDFAACVAQATRLDGIGWNATEEPPRMSFTGQVTKNPNSGAIELVTQGGRTFQLANSKRLSAIQPGIAPGWIRGFMNDGAQPLTVQGVLSADGKSVLVEGYCPGTMGDFVFGRTKVVHPVSGEVTSSMTKAGADELVQSGHVYLKTSRGEVEVTNPEFKAMLVRVPRLGIILPMKPTETADGRLVIDQKPDFFYALGGRFNSGPQAPATNVGDGLWETRGAFAYDTFTGPVQCRGDAAKYRFENSIHERNWLGGTFVVDANGDISRFAGQYVSTSLGEFWLPGYTDEGNALQTILGGSEVIDRGSTEFTREMGADIAQPE
jgi:hypothetical protein